MSSANLATLGGLGAILLWSTTFAFARSLSETLGPLTSGAAVYLVGGCLCVLAAVARRQPLANPARLPRRFLIGCGTLFVSYTVVLYVAVGIARTREQLLEVSILNYLWPMLTILLSIPLQRKRAKPWLLPGTALALIGIFLVLTQNSHLSWTSMAENFRSRPMVYLLALGAAATWALYSNLTRLWAGGGADGAVTYFILGTGILLLALRFAVGETSTWSARPVAEVLGLSAVTVLAYVLWDTAMRKGNLLLVAACSYFTPLLSAALTCAYLNVAPARGFWAGCLLLVTGSLVTWRSISEENSRRSAAEPLDRRLI